MKSPTKGPWDDGIARYLAHKHALGKQITPADISGFVESRLRHSSQSYNGLIGSLRGLFDWMVVHEELLESPLRCENRRSTAARRPFLFDVDQARRLLEAAALLPGNPRAQARDETYRMIFALLYGLCLRLGEVSRLCREDVDLHTRVLTIRQTKFGKDRVVPFGPKMAGEIAGFLQRVESRSGPISPDSPVFSFGKENRKPIGTNTISWTFHKPLPAVQLVVPSGVAAPHLHCLRHSFAGGTLMRWYREGVDPMSRLFDLSTFLGHVSPSSTAVYLTITTELLEYASTRFAHFAENSRKEGAR